MGNEEYSVQLQNLVSFGHEIFVVKPEHELVDLPIDYDVVVSLSDNTTESGYVLAQQLDLPFYSHIDWVCPWLVFKESEHDWGYFHNIPYNEKVKSLKYYQNILRYWSLANVKSLSSKCFEKLVVEINGYNSHPKIKYTGPDTDELKKFKYNYNKKNEVTVVSRFLPYKRITHVISALQKINYDGILNIVGEGTEKYVYEMLMGNLNVAFYPISEKYNLMSRSLVTVCLQGGRIPAESIYLGTPVVSYDSEYQKEIYRDTLIYAQNNSITDLSVKIKEALSFKDTERLVMRDEFIYMVENKMLNVLTLYDSTKLLESIIKVAVDKK